MWELALFRIKMYRLLFWGFLISPSAVGKHMVMYHWELTVPCSRSENVAIVPKKDNSIASMCYSHDFCLIWFILIQHHLCRCYTLNWSLCDSIVLILLCSNPHGPLFPFINHIGTFHTNAQRCLTLAVFRSSFISSFT